jgi:3-oxoacyl-[acyl-carrier-protein] synthase II
MPNRVVITGIGPVTSAGFGRATFFQTVWRHEVEVRPIPAAFSSRYAFHSPWYIPLPRVNLADYGIRLLRDGAMQIEDRMTVLGAKLAFEDAGYSVAQQDGRFVVAGIDEASIIIGTGLGGLQTAFESYLCHSFPPGERPAIIPNKSSAYNRMVITKTMPNSPAAWASICFGFTGSCHTVNASCASGTYAIGEAFRRIKEGCDSVVLAGGVECLQDPIGAIMRGFDTLGALTQSADGRPRPFDKNRSGFLFAEGGACLLVLEELEQARRRQAKIYAEILDYRANSDAYNIVQIDPEGKQIVRLLRQLSAGRKIDYLNAHGTGTVPNDTVETRAIQAVFGHQFTQPLVNSTKGILGHTFGASGAIEAAVTAWSVSRDTVHGNLIGNPVDNLNLPLDPVTGPIEYALSVSYGFGGHNGGLLLGKYHESR